MLYFDLANESLAFANGTIFLMGILENERAQAELSHDNLKINALIGSPPMTTWGSFKLGVLPIAKQRMLRSVRNNRVFQ